MALDTPVKSKTNVLKFHSEEDVAVALANYTADLSKKHIREKVSFSVVLSRGTLIDTMRYACYFVNGLSLFFHSIHEIKSSVFFFC